MNVEEIGGGKRHSANDQAEEAVQTNHEKHEKEMQRQVDVVQPNRL